MDATWTIRRYSPDDLQLWDNLASQSRQGTMLHLRGYMDYHADRFTDCSLIACKNGTPTAILPANIAEDRLYSHQGLTYGSWLTPRSHFDGDDMLRLFDAWIGWCRGNGISKIFYKPVPHIYHRIPAEEDLYALFRYGAKPWYTNLSSAIDLTANPGFNTQQRRHLKKSASESLLIRETDCSGEFMPLLEECLRERHDASPVHSASELQLLKDRFPENIRLFLCGNADGIHAEVCVFDSAGVAHCQYIATSESGRRNGALTHLFHHLITDTFADRKYFDFGTSNEESGRILNAGLLHQKTGLGGRGVSYQAFTLEL